MDDIKARLVECFKIVFPDVDTVEVELISMDNTAAWDSVASITLINVIEDEFHIATDLEAVGELQSFNTVLDYVQQRSSRAV